MARIPDKQDAWCVLAQHVPRAKGDAFAQLVGNVLGIDARGRSCCFYDSSSGERSVQKNGGRTFERDPAKREWEQVPQTFLSGSFEKELVLFTALSTFKNAFLTFVNHNIDFGSATVTAPVYGKSFEGPILAAHCLHLRMSPILFNTSQCSLVCIPPQSPRPVVSF